MVDPHIACDRSECHSCASNKEHLCERLAFLGASGAPGGGGLSEYAAVDEPMLYELPENVKLADAAIIEPLVVANHVLKVVGTSLKGLDILIVGGGPIGIALASLLRAQDAKIVLLSEPTSKRRQQAVDLRLMQRVFDPKAEDVGKVCQEATGGKGVDVVFDCAGVQAALESALDGIAYGGSYVNVAMWEKPVPHVFILSYMSNLGVVDDTILSILPKRDQVSELVLLQQRRLS